MEGQNASPGNGQLAGNEGQASWFDDVHADFQSEKSLEKFTKDTEGLNNIVKSYLSLEKKMGSAVNIPGENATEEEAKDFRRKLGIPESPDKYEVKYKEHEFIKISEEADKGWKEFSHKIGLTPKQAQALADYEFDRLEGAYAIHAKKYQDAQDALRQEFGNGYQDVLDRANNTLRSFSDPSIMNAMTDPDGPYANDPNIIKLLANVGAQMKEHVFKTGEQRTPQDAKDDIKKKMLEQQLIYMDDSKDSVVRKAANREYQRLAEQIYGNKEVSSSAGMEF